MISRTPRTRYFVGRGPHLYLVDRHRATRLASGGDDRLAAAAILAHTQGQLTSRRLAATFAADVLAPLPEDGYVLDEREVRTWVRHRAVRRETPAGARPIDSRTRPAFPSATA